jgi:hypothetical protein
MSYSRSEGANVRSVAAPLIPVATGTYTIRIATPGITPTIT